MKKLLILMVAIPFLAISQKIKTIEGMVTNGASPLKSVNVYIQDSETGTYTDVNGRYSITVEEGSILVFSFQGMQSQNFATNKISKELNVVLFEAINELEGVTLEKSKYTLRSQTELFDAYNVDKDIVKTKFGLIDKKISGSAIEVREGDQINYAAGNILAVLQSMFAGVQISPDGSPMVRVSPFAPEAVIYNRGAGSSMYNPVAAVYDVDGMIYTDPPLFLDIQNIERVARIPGLAGANLYGTLGAGGVFIITTKSGNLSPTKEHLAFRAKQKTRSKEKIKVITREQAKKNWPTYLQELYEATEFESAKNIYEKYEKQYQSTPQFYLDAYQYFSDELKELTFADRIVSEKQDFLLERPEALKALAFLYESQSRFAKENELVKQLMSRAPNQVHTYLQMANSFRNMNKPKKAMSIFARYNYLIDDGFLADDKTGFGPIMNRERDNLLKLEKENFGETTITNTSFSKDDNTKEKRLVFEWNDIDAEFELQFVNPKSQSFTWEHTLAANSEEISSEKNFGYSVKEFMLDDSMSGLWKVNVTYIGSPKSTPTYLKTSIYENYNQPTQIKSVNVYKMLLKNTNQELFSIH